MRGGRRLCKSLPLFLAFLLTVFIIGSFPTSTYASPPAPTITSPGSSSEPGPIIDTLTPTLRWNAVSGADYYALAISKYPYGSGNIIYNPQQVTGTSHTVPNGTLVAGEKYRWNMQAYGSGGWSGVSNTLYFQTQQLAISARIDSYTPSSRVDVTLGNSAPISVTFTNTGNTAWSFIAGATVWDSAGNQVANYARTLSSPLQPGQQTTVNWTHPVNQAGDYWLQFGIWKATPYTGENLLDKKPSPSQNLIRGVSVPQPTISYSPSSFSFTATQGGSNPSGQTLSIQNSGGGTLSWSVSDDATWLTLSPTSGTSTGETDSVAVSVSVSGMNAGSYSATITISASGATNTPQTLPVNLTINAPTTISARIDSYTPSSRVDVTVGNSAPISVTFTNTGNTAWSFIAGATVWDSAGNQVANYSQTLSGPLQPGQQTTVSWTHPVGQAGDYWLQFGIWKATPYTSENLLDKKPSPSQNLISGIAQETITTPSTPTGPSSGQVNQSLAYSTGGASSSLGHSLEYRFDWGDGSYSIWSSSTTASHSWSSPATYTVRAQARCTFHTSVVSNWSSGLSVSITSPSISARIDSYSPASRVDVTIGNSTPISVTFTNIGNTAWSFIAGATVWDSAGNQVANYSRTLSSPLQPGQQTTVSWTHPVNQAGDYWLQFGIWKATPYTSENLLDKKPEPSQNLIKGVSAPQPTISYSPSSFSFSAAEGGSNPSSQTLSIQNSATGALNWSVSDDATWLTLSPTSGTSTGETDSVAVSVSISGMNAGSYSATITISASGATNTPQTVPVSLNISSAQETITTPNAPSGPTSGQVNQSLTYSSGGASSNLGHGLEYRFDWGDGTYSSWSSSTSASHSWSSQGTYTIKAQVRCATHTDVVSSWSSGLSVSIAPPSTVSARIDSYTPSSRVDVAVGSSTTISVTFTNTGNTAWSFIAGATVWDSAGNQVANYARTLSSPLQPGQQTTVNWTHPVNQAGDYWLQFGIWKATPYTGENLLDKKPSPSQVFIRGVELVERHSLTTSVDPAGGGSVSLSPQPDSDGKYSRNSVVTLTVSPASGYRFSYWGGDVSGSQNTTTITMNSDKSVVAYFTTGVGRIILTQPVHITPPGPYSVGVTLTATFTVKNTGSAAITLDKLLLGGRFKAGELPPDFTYESITLQSGDTHQYEGTFTIPESGSYDFFIAYYIENPSDGEKAFLDENNWNTAIELGAGLSDADRKWSLTTYLPQAKVTKWEITNLWEESTLHKFLNKVRSVSGYTIDARIDIYVDDDEPVWLMEIKLIETEPSTGEVISVEVVGVPKVGPRHYSLHLQRYTFSSEKYLNYLTTLTEILLKYYGLVTFRLPATPEPPPKVAITDIIITDKNINTVHITQSEAGQVLPERLQTYADAVVSWIDINNLNLAHLSSPGELRVYDSQNRVTGLIDREVREEIPNSTYDEQNKIVVIYLPSDTYHYEVVGTDEGTYGLNVASIRQGEVTSVEVTDVPTSERAVHRYTVNWDALRKGEPSIGVQVDSDGDKTFEETKILQPPIASFVFSPVDASPVAATIRKITSIMSFVFSPADALAREEINFDASQSRDVDGEIVRYQWSFGDGNTSTGRLVTHAYSALGEYIVTLAVLDNDGIVSTHSKIIQVGERPAVPIWVWPILVIGVVFVLAVIILIVRTRRSV